MADLFGEEEVAVTEGQYVVLVSSDGHRFYVSRKVAIASNTIKEMLSGPGTQQSPPASSTTIPIASMCCPRFSVQVLWIGFRSLSPFFVFLLICALIQLLQVSGLRPATIPSTSATFRRSQSRSHHSSPSHSLHSSHILQQVCVYFYYRVRRRD